MDKTKTYLAGDDIEKYGKIPENINVNEELYNSIIKEVKQVPNKMALAIELYKALNKRVIYDELYSAFKDDLKFVKNKSIEDVTLENNEIICTIWAELYATILRKNNIDAVVSGTTHKYVIFCADNHFIKADATENIRNEQDSSRLTDLVRAKLDIRPYHLHIYEKGENGQINYVQYYESNYYKTHQKELDTRHFLNYTTKILKLLKENKTYKEYRKNPQTLEEVISKISTLLNQEKLGPVEEMMYINNLLWLYLSEEEYQKITKDYIKILKDDDIIYGLLINYSKEEIKNPRCYDFHPPINGKNYLYTKETKIIPITEDEAYNLQVKNDEIELNEDEYFHKFGGKK